MCLCQIDIMDWSVDFLLTTTTTELQGGQKIQLDKYNQPTSTDTDEKVDQSQLEIVPPCISIVDGSYRGITISSCSRHISINTVEIH